VLCVPSAVGMLGNQSSIKGPHKAPHTGKVCWVNPSEPGAKISPHTVTGGRDGGAGVVSERRRGVERGGAG